MTLNAKIKVFTRFFWRFLTAIYKFHEQIALKSLEIDWESLHIKLSALNVVFTDLNFAPLHSRNFPYGGIKLVYPLENIHVQPLEWQQPREMVVPSGVYECIVPNVSCWDRRAYRFFLQWAFKHAPLSLIPLCIS